MRIGDGGRQCNGFHANPGLTTCLSISVPGAVLGLGLVTAGVRTSASVMGDTVTDNHYSVSRDDTDNNKSATSSGDESDTEYVPNSDTNDDFNNNTIDNNNNDPNNNDVNEGEAAEVEESVTAVSTPAAVPLYCRAPGPSACPCPAVYSAPAPAQADTAAYYQLPPPDYQELSPTSLTVQPNLPRRGAVCSVKCLMDPRNCSIKRLYVSLIKTT